MPRLTATAAQRALPGMDAGRRVQRVEWGLRRTADTVLERKGEVTIRSSEEQARECVGRPELGWRGTDIVRRTVVTSTTAWERAEHLAKDDSDG
jgi:hypothetical protein